MFQRLLAPKYRESRVNGAVTDDESSPGGRLAVDLLQELGLEGDQADEAIYCHQVGDDHQCVDAVPEESSQRRDEVWGKKERREAKNNDFVFYV